MFNNILKTFQHLIIFLFSLLIISSCSKKTDDSSVKDEKQAQAISEDNYKETPEDLMTVDYKQFYDELASHGEWVEVSASDLGLKLKSDASVNSNEHKSLVRFIGIEDIYAASSLGIDIGTFFVWKPAPDLAVGVTAGDPSLAVSSKYSNTYVPYTNGQWVNTNDGWYFRAPTPYEETVHHYGRWVYSPDMGYVWVPGRVWSPAWVDWRTNKDYVAWAPLPPDAYIVSDVVETPVIVDDRYVVVENKYFLEPRVYQYYYTTTVSNTVVYQTLVPAPGITVINNTIINRGPEVVTIERVYNRPIEVVQINKVKMKEQIKYTTNVYNVYTPQFMKIKHVENIKTTVTRPQNFARFDDVKKTIITHQNAGGKNREQINRNDNKNQSQDKSVNRDNIRNKEKRPIDKGEDPNRKNYNKQNKGNENKGKDNNIIKGNQNKNQNNGNSGDKQNKGKDNGKQNNRDQNKGQDKGNHDKGHGKGK